LALKELNLSPEDLYRITGTNMTEAQILKIMNGLGHPHLLLTLAHYRRDDKEYFLFPWAERGSLRKYWENTTPNPTPDYVMWLVAQMAGLSDAVSALHSKKCRHGDLKPDNILCFGGQKKNDAAENIVLPPDRLVVGDLGLAKIHEFITAMRENVATKTKAGTLMYSPPEYEQGGTAPWSRLFDIWSLGCIYLEFIVWLLHGNDGLRSFSQSVGPNGGEKNTFYTIIGGYGKIEARLAVHPTVTQWIEKLLSDPRCGTSTALRRVIRLIADEMIVVALPPDGAADGRERAGVDKDMERIQTPGLPKTGQPPIVRIHAATTIEAQDKERVRATARSVSDKLANLLGEMKRGLTQAMTPPPPNEPNQPPPAKPAPGSLAGNRGKGALDVPVRRRIPSALSDPSADK
jgi:serine/threonine protein kinase